MTKAYIFPKIELQMESKNGTKKKLRESHKFSEILQLHLGMNPKVELQIWPLTTGIDWAKNVTKKVANFRAEVVKHAAPRQ